MKTKITTIIIAFVLAGLSAKAQTSINYKNELPSFLANGYNNEYTQRSPQWQTYKPDWGWFYNWSTTLNNWNLQDSVHYYYNALGSETLDSMYYPSVKTILVYTYNSNNKLINLLRQSYSGGVWMNQSNTDYTYDANSNQLSATYQYWNGFNWYNSYRNLFTYDANNNQTQNLYQRWNGITWKDFNKFNYAFDANNSLTGYDYYTNDTTTNIWTGLFKGDYFFDAVHMTKAIAYNWDTTTSSWDSLNKSVLSYTGSICSSFNSYKWNGASWQNDRRSTTLTWHQGGDLLVGTNIFTSPAKNSDETIQVWKPASSTWEDTLRYTNVWDPNNNQTDEQHENYDGTAWHNFYYKKDIYTYDANNNIVEHIYQYWNTTSQSLVNNKKEVYADYQLITNIKNNEADNSILIYPNPANESLTLSTKYKVVSIKMYNVLGECVYQSLIDNQQSQISIDVSKESKGIYFVQITDENKNTFSKKIIIQ